MFTYYIHDEPRALRFELVGALTDENVAELEQCRRTASSTIAARAFVVDMRELTTLDEAGSELLHQWRISGAQFREKSAAPVSSCPVAGLSFGVAAVLILLTLLLPGTVLASGAIAEPAPAPSLLLARYTAALEKTSPWLECRTAVLEIEAALPQVAKHGRLQAVRRLVPFDRPEYQVLQSEGDRTVRQQVIARYLSAESQAETLPAGSVAVSPANYKFRYVASIGSANTLTYVYQITPRRKRSGLMQGELWIDASTGIAIRKAGRLVKSPSVFLRRVDIVQETDIREGRPYLRITHLDIDTRLLGRAELTIRERPCASDSDVKIAAVSTTQEGVNDLQSCSLQ